MQSRLVNPIRNRITNIAVMGYKSIRNNQSIEVAPLTVLAGANSSGKSSMMQPLLLLKQTLEAAYDPGPLLLDGTNVRFSQADQLFYKGENEFAIQLQAGKIILGLTFAKKDKKSGLQLSKMEYKDERLEYILREDMNHEEVRSVIQQFVRQEELEFTPREFDIERYNVIRNRCFFELRPITLTNLNISRLADTLQSIIHLPGLRGNPERNYPVTAVGYKFPGTFENYTATVIAKWQEENSPKIGILSQQLVQLGLTWKVTANRLDDTRVELKVGRTLSPIRGGAKDLVSVADVGVGVSQTLPILVSLLTASQGQLVYLEQPEIHLHPRAQVAMAQILADAAKRKVRIVVETHSSLLLLAIQTLIAEGKLSQNDVKLHWFRRNEHGETTISTAELDSSGAFGDWPEDFGEVALEAEQAYLDAADTITFGAVE